MTQQAAGKDSKQSVLTNWAEIVPNGEKSGDNPKALLGITRNSKSTLDKSKLRVVVTAKTVEVYFRNMKRCPMGLIRAAYR